MKVDFIQTSFAGGEFGPSLLGRTDIAQYANACSIVENMLVRPYGPVISTPGTTYVGTVSNSTLRTRLIKFVFNRSDSYVIEMGKNYFRFYTNGGIVCTTGTTPFVLYHIYSDTEVFNVQFTQLNDIIYLTHPSHPPQKLVRKSSASWTISDAPILGGPFLDNNTPAVTSAGITATTITITPSATAGTINITVSPTNSSLFTVSAGTLGHQGSYWMIGGLAQTNGTTGLQEIGYVRITNVVNSYTATATVIKNLKASTATTVWAEGAWNPVRGYPSCVIFHERRLWFARTNYEPQNIWGSKTFEFENFSLDTQADDDGLDLALASNESNEIQWIASGKSLIAGTFGGAFIVNSKSTDPITPNNVTSSEEIGYGTSNVVPKKIGGFLYYIQKFGRKVREVFYDFYSDTYKAVDRTILSPHILGDGVIEIDVQDNPQSILYCVLTNGTLATMTREIDQELTSWSRQTTTGTYSSIAIIPSQTGLYDEAWVIVERWINGTQKKYIEVFDNIDPPGNQELCNYLHSSLLYDSSDAQTANICFTDIIEVTTAGTLGISKSIYKIDTRSVFLDGSTGSLSLPGPTNKINNGSFETGSPPANWTFTDYGTGGSFLRDGTIKKFDSYSGKLTNGTGIVRITNDFLPGVAARNKTYTFGCWVYSNKANSTILIIQDSTISSTSSPHSGNSSWEWLTVERAISSTNNVVQFICTNILPGTTSYFDAAIVVDSSDNPGFDFGYGDFTIDWWENRITDTNAVAAIIRDNNSSNSNPSYMLGYSNTATGNLEIYMSSIGNGSTWDVASGKSLGPCTLNVWNHFSVVRSGNNFYAFKNGVLTSSWTSSASFFPDPNAFSIGALQNTYFFHGYIDEVRVSKGVARWVSNFIPQTVHYEPDSYTVLLLHFEDNFLNSAFEVPYSATVTVSTASFVGANVGKRLRFLDSSGNVAGLATITATLSTLSATVSVTQQVGSKNYSAGYWGISVSSISGLDHLEGEQVYALSDGGTGQAPMVVSAGAITLDEDYFIVRVGKNYDQIIKTLPKEAGSQRGTSQGKVQKINEIRLKVNRSYPGIYVGMGADSLDLLQNLDGIDGSLLYTGTIPNLSLRSDYQYGSTIYIKNSSPLPIEILSIVGTLETYDK